MVPTPYRDAYVAPQPTYLRDVTWLHPGAPFYPAKILWNPLVKPRTAHTVISVPVRD